MHGRAIRLPRIAVSVAYAQRPWDGARPDYRFASGSWTIFEPLHKSIGFVFGPEQIALAALGRGAATKGNGVDGHRQLGL